MKDILHMLGDADTPIPIRMLLLFLILSILFILVFGIVQVTLISYWIPVSIFSVLYVGYKFCKWCERL